MSPRVLDQAVSSASKGAAPIKNQS